MIFSLFFVDGFIIFSRYIVMYVYLFSALSSLECMTPILYTQYIHTDNDIILHNEYRTSLNRHLHSILLLVSLIDMVRHGCLLLFSSYSGTPNLLPDVRSWNSGWRKWVGSQRIFLCLSDDGLLIHFLERWRIFNPGDFWGSVHHMFDLCL